MSPKMQANIANWTLWIAAIAFLMLGLRTFVFPSAAAKYYGATAVAPDAMMFVKAYGARNIAISLAVILLLVGGHYRALSKLLFPVSLIALFDAWIVYESTGAGFVKHLIYTLVIVALGGLSVRRSQFLSIKDID